MSTVSIRAALESAVNAMSPSIDTAWENVQFKPSSGSTPFQMVHIMWAEPDNAEIGNNHQEIGFMQISLMYPLHIGTSTANARAELIRSTFYRGASFVSGGYTVNIMQTPEIMPSNIEESRLVIRVKIPFRVFVPT